MDNDELYRVEETINAVDSGNLDPVTYAHSCVVALGLSGQRNPLGAAVLHLIDHPNDLNRRAVLFHLGGELVRRGICSEQQSIDFAADAVSWFESNHCPKCHGRGVLNFEQALCSDCGGSGERKRPPGDVLNDAIDAINGALDWLERQQRARLKSA